MRTRNRYKFTLTAVLLDEVLFSQQVHPQISDLNMKYTKEANQVYYVPSFESALTFVETEFDLIVSQDIRAKFSLSMVDTYHIFSTKQMSFMRTDCEIDVNHKLVTVTPKLFNPYKKLIDKRDEEYSVVDMGLEKRQLSMRIFPIKQFYVQNQTTGDTQIHIFDYLGQHKAVTANSTQIINSTMVGESGYVNYHMSMPQCIIAVKLGDHQRYPGFYVGDVSTGGLYDPAHPDRYIFVEFDNPNYPHAMVFTMIVNGQEMNYYAVISNCYGVTAPVFITCVDIAFNDRVDSQYRQEIASLNKWYACARLLCDWPETQANKLDSNDNLYETSYRYAMPSTAWGFRASRNSSDTPNAFGQIGSTGLYYMPPDNDVNTRQFVPVYKQSWIEGVSFWVYAYDQGPTQAQIQNNTRLKATYDYYKLADVIQCMLMKLDTNVVFEPDELHSQFLFSPINPLLQNRALGQLFITQKSNILNYNYDYPAWKAPIKWAQIEEFLTNALNCFTEVFFSEADNKWHLRIEHISYYMNDHTYINGVGNNAVVDLIQARDGFNRESLSFRTNRWKYDTESQADRYEFGWMDQQSETFDGKPLIVTSDYSLYEDARKEELKVSWFSSDIDFLVSVPSECSSDGFVVVLSIDNSTVEATTEQRQNYSLSFEYLIPRFHLYNKYAEKMQVEGTDIYLDVEIRKKMRIAEDIQFKVPENIEIQPSNLVKTEAGFAEIDTITIDMTDNSCTATLRYETL